MGLISDIRNDLENALVLYKKAYEYQIQLCEHVKDPKDTPKLSELLVKIGTNLSVVCEKTGSREQAIEILNTLKEHKIEGQED